jgi:hypothetical protein
LGEVLLLEVWWQLLLLLMLKVRLERELLIEENWLLSHSNLRWLHVLLLLHCGLLRGHLNFFFFQQKKQFSRLSKAEMNFCRGHTQKKEKRMCSGLVQQFYLRRHCGSLWLGISNSC